MNDAPSFTPGPDQLVGAQDGPRTYTPARHGSPTATVAAHDNGGTGNGGIDTSPLHTLSFTFTE